MSGSNRRKFDTTDVKKHGRIKKKSKHFSIISKSRYIVLRISNVPPHRLEIYHNINSSSGKVINLENVRFVNSIKNVFVIEFDLKVLHFICENDKEATEWVTALQSLHILTLEPQSTIHHSREIFPVSFMPSSRHWFHGPCDLVISEISVCIMAHSKEMIGWPFDSIQCYGLEESMFKLTTARDCEVGEGDFYFHVARPHKPREIYNKVAYCFQNMVGNNDPYLTVSPSENHERTIGHRQTDSRLQESQRDDVYLDTHTPAHASSSTSHVTNHVRSPPVTERQPDLLLPDDEQRTRILSLIDMFYTVVDCEHLSHSWNSIYGLDDAKKALSMFFTSSRNQFQNSGVLLYGPSQSGKRTLAEALAHDMSAKFINISCQALFHLSGSQKTVAEILGDAHLMSPCVLFFEHVDFISRLPGLCSEIMKLFDTVYCNQNIYIVASTKNPASVNPAMISPTGFSQSIYIPSPDFETRVLILRSKLLQGRTRDAEIFIKTIASRTNGFTYGNLDRICTDIKRQSIELALELDNEDDLQSVTPLQVESNRLQNLFVNQFVEWCIIDNCAQYYCQHISNDEVPLFWVRLADNRLLPHIDRCFLAVTSTDVEIRDFNPSCMRVVWPLNRIRQFAYESSIVTLESGRRTITGEGLFCFESNDAKEIYELLMARTRRS